MHEEQVPFTNRLIHEKSPYLQQHAHNPVDWYPWGVEAFQAAKDHDKPIFLSIGYSTCHWCHVMEEESFADAEVAQAINQAFIPVKVDREELPEVDSLYMEFAQTMIVGSAGWPLNILLTPELKPFFAATYIPKNSTRGVVGVIELSQKISELWKSEERNRLAAQADKIVEILKQHAHVEGKELPEEELIEQTVEILFKIADPVYGGMKGAPKFPLGYQARLLLQYYLRTQDTRALFLVEKTLEMMHRGGINDQIGGGFSRYSVDEQWVVPHFEKMLYDNAILATAYVEAFRVTDRARYKQAACEILNYLLRDMASPDGGFYSAEDADSCGIEGLFYTWTYDEILQVIGKESGPRVAEFFGVYEGGANFEDRWVLHTPYTIEEFASGRGMKPADAFELIHNAKKMLFDARTKRPRPARDEKILTSWNGLVITAFAQAGQYLEEPLFVQAAQKTARFIQEHLYIDGVLQHRLKDGEARFRASLDDYVFLIQGLLALFDATQDSQYISWAIDLTSYLEANFKAEGGAFYQTDGSDEHLLLRKMNFSDGAEPSGNAVHTENLLKLFEITGNAQYLQQAEDIMKAAEHYLSSYPLGYCYHLIALQRYYDQKKATLVVALNSSMSGLSEIKKALIHKVYPHHSVIVKKEGDELLTQVLPRTKEYTPVKQNTTLYLCRNEACEQPINSIDEIVKKITSF
jgi:uncharacterized protein YyaL (SSP411 family)